MEYAAKGCIRGHVQGVGYRLFIQQLAHEKDIKGWAKNLDDGSVEVVLQGKREDVNELQHKASMGPLSADVRSLSWQLLHEAGQDAFTIR